VTVTVEAGAGLVGYRKVLTCRYAWIPPCPNKPDGTVCTLIGMRWTKESDYIGFLHHEAGDSVEYYGEYNEPNYVISSTDISTGCDLTIQSVAQTDAGSYECLVYTRFPGSHFHDTSQAVLTLRTLGEYMFTLYSYSYPRYQHVAFPECIVHKFEMVDSIVIF
jgi:hypothetical protein